MRKKRIDTLAGLAAAFDEQGASAIRTLMQTKPSAFMKVIVQIVRMEDRAERARLKRQAKRRSS